MKNILSTAVAAALMMSHAAVADPREFNNGAGNWNMAEDWTPPGRAGRE